MEIGTIVCGGEPEHRESFCEKAKRRMICKNRVGPLIINVRGVIPGTIEVSCVTLKDFQLRRQGEENLNYICITSYCMLMCTYKVSETLMVLFIKLINEL